MQLPGRAWATCAVLMGTGSGMPYIVIALPRPQMQLLPAVLAAGCTRCNTPSTACLYEGTAITNYACKRSSIALFGQSPLIYLPTPPANP